MAYQRTDMQALTHRAEPYRVVVLTGDVRFELRHNVVNGIECVTPILRLPENLLSNVDVRDGDVNAACKTALRESAKVLSLLAEIMNRSENGLK